MVVPSLVAVIGRVQVGQAAIAIVPEHPTALRPKILTTSSVFRDPIAQVVAEPTSATEPTSVTEPTSATEPELKVT